MTRRNANGGYEDDKCRGATLLLFVLVCVVAGFCFARSQRALKRADAAMSQANEARRELRQLQAGGNTARLKLRARIDAADVSADLCHRRLDLVIDAVDAVAKTCPGRFRAPKALQDAKRLGEGR